MRPHMSAMRWFAVAMLLLPVPSPASADEDGLGLMERGAEMLLEGLLQEMAPALDGLQDFADGVGPALQEFVIEMGPALRDLVEQIEDWSVYHPPEILDNGDIIIRRKSPEPAPLPGVEPEGEIEI